MTGKITKALARIGGTSAPVAQETSGLRHFLAKPVPAPLVPPRPPAKPQPSKRARITFGIDATASREFSVAASRDLTAALMATIPGELEMRLAVHAGGFLHTLSPYTLNAHALRDQTAKITCWPGHTQMLPILERCFGEDRCEAVIYIGDVLEESEAHALRLASALGQQKTRLFILHDTNGQLCDGRVFAEMARRTKGAVIPFNHSALELLREIVEGIAVLSVGGEEQLRTQAKESRGAQLLLEHMKS